MLKGRTMLKGRKCPIVQLLKANRKKCSRFATWMWIFLSNFYFLLFANLFYCHTQVIVTEVLDGDKFYVQTIPDQTATSLQQQLETLNLQEVPLICGFSPKKGDIVLAQFSSDN
uniref:Ubiquitin-like domain-containing protein n=1 Tax=Cucumis sativus TaxID=3659 RepID=A0A0A0L3G7_CUCSA